MKPYIRTTGYTNAAAGLLVIINHFKPEFKLSKENEFRIWHASANLPVRACSIYGLAVFAKKEGLSPKVIVGEKEYEYPDYRFKKYKKVDIDNARFSSKMHAKKADKEGISIEERDFRIEDVKKILDEGKIVLLRVNAGVLRNSKSTSNYVVVFDYDENFSIMDPNQGDILAGDEQLLKAFNTLESKKHRDSRMIVF